MEKNKTTQKLSKLQDLVSLCKRRGFIFQGSEIYGGMAGFWDYGPLGVELKNNLKNSWWKAMTYREDIEGLDSSIIMNPQVWKSSGHIDNFSDPMVDCKKCKFRFRTDELNLKGGCPNCGTKDSFTESRDFNLMFKTHIGPLESENSVSYLRPETAQGIFVNFLNVQSTMRKKLPFGIAQVGKAFRNEITPGNFIFRTREFEQMEMQYFVRPGENKKHFEKWLADRWDWYLNQGINEKSIRITEHDKLAHYADFASDIEFKFPEFWGEIEGVHSRTDFDLKGHQQGAGKSLTYVDQSQNNEKYIPFVVETSAGLGRNLLAILCDAYTKEIDEESKEERVVLKLAYHLAPIKVAVLPLMKKDNIEKTARELYSKLNSIVKCEYDSAGSIGKRYRRQDEIGTPYCITVDYDSLEDGQVTIRHRDSMKQSRVPMDKIQDLVIHHL